MSVRKQLLYLHPEICKRLRGCSGNCYDVFLFISNVTKGWRHMYLLDKKSMAIELDCTVRAIDKSLAVLVRIKAVKLVRKGVYKLHPKLYTLANTI